MPRLKLRDGSEGDHRPMRKRLKRKKRSCALCKPHKMGWDNRWKPREEARLRAFERTRRAYVAGVVGARPDRP